jgi:hypothetical protein
METDGEKALHIWSISTPTYSYASYEGKRDEHINKMEERWTTLADLL